MKGRLRLWGVIGFMMLVLSLFLGSKGSVQAETKVIRIGGIMPISGPISVIGMAWTRGWELFFDKINDEGGLKIGEESFKVEFIIEDSKLNPEAAGTAARKLVYKDKAKFVFGAILSPCAASIYQVTAPAKVLHIISWIDIPGGHWDVSPKKPLCVRGMVSSDAMYEIDYDYLKRTYPDAKKIVVVAPDLGYEKMIERAKKVAGERGQEIIAVELWPWGTSDFMPVYTKALAHKPDAIHCMISAQANYQLRTARQLGFKGPFFQDSPLGPDVILRVAGPEACDDVFGNGMDLSNPTPAMKEVIDRWQAKYKEPFVSDTILAWDESWLLVQAMKKAGSVDPVKVAAAFDLMTEQGSLQTVFGPARMGGAERFGVNRVLVRPIPISTIMKGKIGLDGLHMPAIE